MNAPGVGLFRRGLAAVLAAAAVSVAAHLFLRSPEVVTALSFLPPAVISDAGLALMALVVGFSAGGLVIAFLLDGPDRAAGLAVQALQGDDADADEPVAGKLDLRDVAVRLKEWRERARQAEQSHRRLEESLGRLARAFEESVIEDFRPIRNSGITEEAEQALTRAVNEVLEAVRKTRESAAILLSQIEEDLGAATGPLDDADRRITAGSAALDRSLSTMSRALALIVRALEAGAPNGGEEWKSELAPVRERLEEAVRQSYEARFSLDECLTAMGRARKAEEHVEREIAAVRRRLGGAEVKHLSEADFVPENGRETARPESGE